MVRQAKYAPGSWLQTRLRSQEGVATLCLSDCATLLRSFFDRKFSCFFFFFWPAWEVPSRLLPCTLASRCTRRIRLAVKQHYAWIIAGRKLGRSCRTSKVQPVHECNPSRWIGAGFETGGRKVDQSHACPDGLTSPTLSSFFSRFLFFPGDDDSLQVL